MYYAPLKDRLPDNIIVPGDKVMITKNIQWTESQNLYLGKTGTVKGRYWIGNSRTYDIILDAPVTIKIPGMAAFENWSATACDGELQLLG